MPFSLPRYIISPSINPEAGMKIRAYAKINWSLDITGVRSDGYHLMDMVMQPVSISDEIELIPAPGLEIETDGYPPSRADSSNLAWRAAELLHRECNVAAGVRIRLHKNIPMGAGLGGGSADAAGVLKGLNTFWKLNIPQERLESIGLSLGADVPFCLRGGLVRTRGIGELLENRVCGINYWLLVFQPCRALSTREIFKAYHEVDSVRHPDTENVLNALSSGNPALLASSVFNVLESVSSASCPEIPEAVSALLSAGAFAARMTGSGSAVFGVFRSRKAAESAKLLLIRRYHNIHLCHTQSDSVRIMEE